MAWQPKKECNKPVISFPSIKLHALELVVFMTAYSNRKGLSEKRRRKVPCFKTNAWTRCQMIAFLSFAAN